MFAAIKGFANIQKYCRAFLSLSPCFLDVTYKPANSMHCAVALSEAILVYILEAICLHMVDKLLIYYLFQNLTYGWQKANWSIVIYVSWVALAFINGYYFGSF